MAYLPSQTAVVEFGMAMNRKWKTQQDEQREEVCFVDCKCFGKQAETLNKYVSKGSALLVDGRLHFDQWEDKDGNKRSKLRVIVEHFTFLGGSDVQKPASSQSGGDLPYEDFSQGKDDIPF
jgi:single-strand DNA-binding protein